MATSTISWIATAVLAAPTLSFDDLFVDANAVCGLGDGSSAQPYCTITEAVGAALSGDTIHVAPGVYLEHVVIGQPLTLLGTQGAELTTVDGGGAGGSTIRITGGVDVTIEGFTVTGGNAALGAGIRTSGSLTLRNSTLSGNDAIGGIARGGGLYANGMGETITIEDCVIEENAVQSLGSFAHGGGLSVRHSLTVILNSTIRSNAVDSPYYPNINTSGGGVDLFQADLQMSGCTVSGNSLEGEGGGIFSRIGTVHITNTTISGNRAQRGTGIGALYPTGPSYLGNVTVVENSSTYYLSPVWAALEFGSFELRSCVVADNGLNAYPLFGYGAPDLRGGMTSLGDNFIGNVGDATFVQTVGDQVGVEGARLDPQLGPLQDNGGPTLTHKPLPGSSLIDGVLFPPFPMYDQRGFARPQANHADIGAVEVGQTFASSCNGDGGDQLGCTSCPCANESPQGTIGGCQNRVANAGLLTASGDTSLSQPVGSEIDLRFGLSGVPPLAFCVLTSGAAATPTNPANPCFGQGSGVQSASYDGLRCIAQEIRRHGGRPADASGEVGETNSPWGGEGAPPAGLAHAFGGFSAGQLRYFQSIYREDPLLGCMRGLNTTQTIEVIFVP